MTRIPIGVGVSKNWLDVHRPRRGDRRIANDAAEIRRWLRSLDASAIIVFEATRRHDCS